MDFATFEKIAKNVNPEEGVFARFYDRAVKTGKLSDNGLPKFKNVCFCEIRIKDNNSEVYDQPASEDKIRRFPVEYARYQMSKKQAETGTPIEQFAFLSIAEIETLKTRGIFTVEALAQIPVERALELGVEDEKALAGKFLEKAKDNMTLYNWQKKEEEYVKKIQLLEKQIEQLSMVKTKTRGKVK